MQLTIGTFNLRNLALPHVNIYKDLRYTEQEYRSKVSWSAEQLKRMNADIVAFQECFNEKALLELKDRSGYQEAAHLFPREEEGEPCVALLSRLPIKSSKIIAALPENCCTDEFQHFRRPLLHTKIQLSSKQNIHIFAVHLKSKQPLLTDDSDPFDPIAITQGLARSLRLRSVEAMAIRQLVLNVLPEPVIVLGDLNDGPHSVTTQIICGPHPPYGSDKEQEAQFLKSRLHSVSHTLTQRSLRDVTYTHIYDGIYENIDHILISDHFSQNNNQALGEILYVRFLNDHLIDHMLKGAPANKHASDHGQLVATLELK